MATIEEVTIADGEVYTQIAQAAYQHLIQGRETSWTFWAIEDVAFARHGTDVVYVVDGAPGSFIRRYRHT